MALTIKKTHAELSAHVSLNAEMHGKDEVACADFTLSGIMLEEEDITEMYDDKLYYRTLINEKGKLKEPMTRLNGPIHYLPQFKKSLVTLWVGIKQDDTLKLSECRVKDISLEVQTGGLVSLSCKVRCFPDEADMKLIYRHKGQDVMCSIRFGKEDKPSVKAAPELPLDHQSQKKDGEAAAPTVN